MVCKTHIGTMRDCRHLIAGTWGSEAGPRAPGIYTRKADYAPPILRFAAVHRPLLALAKVIPASKQQTHMSQNSLENRLDNSAPFTPIPTTRTAQISTQQVHNGLFHLLLWIRHTGRNNRTMNQGLQTLHYYPGG